MDLAASRRLLADSQETFEAAQLVMGDALDRLGALGFNDCGLTS